MTFTLGKNVYRCDVLLLKQSVVPCKMDIVRFGVAGP